MLALLYNATANELFDMPRLDEARVTSIRYAPQMLQPRVLASGTPTRELDETSTPLLGGTDVHPGDVYRRTLAAAQRTKAVPLKRLP